MEVTNKTNLQENKNANVEIRLALKEDMATVCDLIKEMAIVQGHPDGPQLTVPDLIEDGFDSPSPWFFVLLAERDKEVVGAVMGSRTYCNWTSRGFYLQGLYVKPNARRCGIAEGLMKEFCRIAQNEKVDHVEWYVPYSNTPALALYKRLNAYEDHTFDDHAFLRLDRERINNIANK